MQNKLTISNIAWNLDEELNVFNSLNEFQVQNIELAPTKIFNDIYTCSDSTILEYKEFLNKHNLNPCAFQSILFGENDLQVFNKNTWNKFFKRIERVAYIAKLLNVKVLVFGAPKNRIKNNRDYNIAIEFFQRVSEIIKPYNCNIGLEANPTIYNCDFLNTTKEVIEFVKQVNCENIQLHLDTGAMLINHEDINLIKDIDIPICHVHLSEEYLKTLEHDIYFYEKVFILLKERKYNNYISIEMKRQENGLSSVVSSIKHVLKGLSLCQIKNNMTS